MSLRSRVNETERKVCDNYSLIMALKQKIKALEFTLTNIRNSTLQRQLRCAAKTGHKFKYETWEHSIRAVVRVFIFKCSHCGLEIAKTRDELTTKEEKALIDLGVLKKEEKNERNNS